jgi:hypothetical protein
MEQKNKPEDKQTNKEKSTDILHDLCKHLETLAETIRVKEIFNEKVEVLVNHQSGKAKLEADKLYKILKGMLAGSDDEIRYALRFIKNQLELEEKLLRDVRILARDSENDDIRVEATHIISHAVSDKPR